MRKGDIYGFLGLNGAGKTTTIRLLPGMIRPSGGRAYILAQLASAVGAGAYFPRAVPGLLGGVVGEEGMQMGAVSLWLPFLVGCNRGCRYSGMVAAGGPDLKGGVVPPGLQFYHLGYGISAQELADKPAPLVQIFFVILPQIFQGVQKSCQWLYPRFPVKQVPEVCPDALF